MISFANPAKYIRSISIYKNRCFVGIVLGFAIQIIGNVSEASYNLMLADHTSKQLFLYSEKEGIVWSKKANALFDAWVLADGSIVYTTQQTAERIIPDIESGKGGESVWIYKYGTGFPKTEGKLPKGLIYTCQPLPDGGFLITESGTFRLVELNDEGIPTKIISIPKTDMEIRYALRLARKSPDGHYFVPYFGDGILKELDASGTVIDSIDVNAIAGLTENSVYETFFLENGELLISCGPQNQIIRIDKNKQVTWRLEASELYPEINLNWITSLFPKANGNILVCNYSKGEAKVKAFEIGRDKQIHWQLKDADPAIKGLTRLQLLDSRFKPLKNK